MIKYYQNILKKIAKINIVLRLLRDNMYSLFAPFYLFEDKRYRHYLIGEYTYGKPTIMFKHPDATLSIGRFCSIAKGVKIYLGGEHRTDWVTTYPFSPVFDQADKFPEYHVSKGDVVIGHDVWIGDEAIILSGVHIGNGAVIGARSVVTKKVAPYSIVAGNPARCIRYRFKNEIIEELEKIAWWNWPIDKIQDALPLLLSSNIVSFINRYKEDEK